MRTIKAIEDFGNGARPDAHWESRTPDLEIGRARFPALQRNRKNGNPHRDRIGVCAEAAIVRFSRAGKTFSAFSAGPQVLLRDQRRAIWIIDPTHNVLAIPKPQHLQKD